MLLRFAAAVCLAAALRVSALSLEDIPESPENGDLWVVLVAGSNGWYNYRHQADVCHAYQIVSAHGIPDDHIIVMMYDDIANNKENPTPGVIINHPNGTDVYKGVVKDYTHDAVNPKTFLQVLKGEKTENGTGKVLKSTEKDNVFVYFADHGAKGLVAFGEEFLRATELNAAIKSMNEKKMFSKLLFYMEACESGSMFQGLLDPKMNVFATTASNATTSSYACYYDPLRKTFLGDVYSIKWLEDSDKENIEKETLEEQYKIVKKETNTSTVCQFGNMDISKLTVGTFQGLKPTVSIDLPIPPGWLSCGATAVPGPEVPVKILERIIEESENLDQAEEARSKLDIILKNRKFMNETVHDIVGTVLQTDDEQVIEDVFNQNLVLTKFECYYMAVDAFHSHCFNIGQNDYALRMLNTFVNLCQHGIDSAAIVEAVQVRCDHPPMTGIY